MGFRQCGDVSVGSFPLPPAAIEKWILRLGAHCNQFSPNRLSSGQNEAFFGFFQISRKLPFIGRRGRVTEDEIRGSNGLLGVRHGGGPELHGCRFLCRNWNTSSSQSETFEYRKLCASLGDLPTGG